MAILGKHHAGPSVVTCVALALLVVLPQQLPAQPAGVELLPAIDNAPATRDAPALPYVQEQRSDTLATPHFFITDNVEFMLRTGAIYPLGHGTMERRVTGGWRLEGSVLQSIQSPWANVGCFWELGLGLSLWDGDSGRLITSGVFRQSLFSPNQFLADMYRTRLERLWQRYGFVALGTNWYVNGMFGTPWRIAARVGTRLGSARAKFDRMPSTALDEAVASAIAGGASPDGFEFDSDVNDSDVFVGLFGSIAVRTVWHDVWLGAWHLGDVSLGAELEFGHDWMDFGDFSRSDGGVGFFGTLITIGLYH